MPRGRKRKDPADAPVDGDYSLDQVDNKSKEFAYALVHNDDLPKFKGMGYVAEERGPDAAKPKWDIGTDGDAGYMARDLKLMKIPTALKERIEAQPLAVAARRMEALKRDFINAGGVFAAPQNVF